MADMHHAIQVEASPDKVYQAIATDAGLRGWWTADSKTESNVGGWRSTEGYFAVCNSTWGELMYRLKDYVEGKRPGPRWTK